MTTNGSEASNDDASYSRFSRTNGSSNGHGASMDNQGLSSNDSLLHATHTESTNGASTSNGANTHTNGGSQNGSSASIPSNLMDEEFSSTGFLPLFEGSNIDRREFLRLTLQSLRELGLDASAKSLEIESGVTLEHPSIVAFRRAILSGDWKNAERLLLDGLKFGAARMMARSDLTLSENNGANAAASSSSLQPNINMALREPHTRGLDSIKFLIYQQRYLELLEAKQTRKALSVLRDRLAPLNQGSDRLHQLSSLVICGTSEELCERANWLGSGVASRRQLLQEIESAISPSIMIPSRRLPQLLEQAQQLQKSRDPFFNLPLDTRISLYVDHQSDRSVFPTRTTAILTEHNDEVWHVTFSNDGKKLASVGKDREVLVWSVGLNQADFQVVKRFGPMNGHICHAAFSPNDKHLLTTSDDGEVIVWDLEDGSKQEFKGHMYTVGTGSWMPDSQGFVTGGMDRKVYFWNLNGNVQHTWSTVPFRVQALDVSPNGRYLVAVSHRYLPLGQPTTTSQQTTSNTSNSRISTQISGGTWFDYPSPALHDEEWHMARSQDSNDVVDLGGGSRNMTNERFQLHFYDIQKKEEIGSIYMFEEMTSVTFSDDSRYILINQRPNDAQIWDFEKQSLVHRFTGHRIHQHVIRSCFGGVEKSFVISGSEDGTIYVYHRKTGKLLDRLRGHSKGSVNSVAWHPRHHNMFASCGDDGTIRIWRPESDVDKEQKEEILSINTMGLGQNRREGWTGNGGYGLLPSGAIEEEIHHITHSNGRERDISSDTPMGPSPFPWATSPRDPGSPSAGQSRRRARRLAARLAVASATSAATVNPSLTEAGRSTGGDPYREEEEEEDEDDEDEEEEDDDDDEDDDDGEDDEEDAMEEGGD